MTKVGTTAQRTSAADQAAATTYTKAKRDSLRIKLDNILAQLIVLRRWLNNAKGGYTDPESGTVYDAFVEMPDSWFYNPGKYIAGNNPQWLPDSALDWTTGQSSSYNTGRYYVFEKIPHTLVWYNRDIKKADVKAAIAQWEKKFAAAQKAIDKANAPAVTTTGTPTTTTTTPTNTAAFATKADLDAQPTVTNVGSVREAYFSARSKAEDIANAIQKVSTVDGVKATYYGADGSDRVGINAPSSIKDASELWLSAVGSKGMLQTYFPPGGYDDTKSDSSQAFDKSYDLTKYGFQFMYNPTTISMDYFATQNVDVAFMMSGQDKFNYVPTSGNSGAITFQILINRIFDMQYYEPNGAGGGRLKENAEKHYAPRAPYGAEYAKVNKNAMDEQSAIYNKGTMYDIEYLLRTILGFKMKSALRREFTADMGFFSRKMVDLHLGPKMRYRGYVNSLHVDHAMFNERMVPTLSRVSITFNRFPDYPNTGAGLPGEPASKAATAAAAAANVNSSTTEGKSAILRALREG